jgi:hypothetical protein
MGALALTVAGTGCSATGQSRVTQPPGTGTGTDGAAGNAESIAGAGMSGPSGLANPDSPVLTITPMSEADSVLKGGCATATVQAELLPSNLLFVIDRSGSMACNPPPTTASAACESDPKRADTSKPSKWEITKTALKSAIAKLPKNVRVGLSYFSNDDACGVNSKPSVALRELEAAQLTAFNSSLDNTLPGGGTPLVGATILAYKHLHQLALDAALTGNSFVVLLTDGQQSEQCSSPGRCANAQECTELLVNDEVPKAIAPGADIRTFVIGAPGSEPARTVLSQIASRGGTGQAGCNPAAGDCHFDMTKQSDFSAALTGALAAISGMTTRCELPLPAADGKSDHVDLSRLNVVYTASQGGAARVVPQDTRLDCDRGANGWQYSTDTGTIRLCGSSCEQIRSDPSARLDVVLGCPVQLPN